MTLLGCGYNELGQIAPDALVKAGLCTEHQSFQVNGTRLYSILPNCKSHDVKLAKWGFSIIQADEELYFFGSNHDSDEDNLQWHKISSKARDASDLTFFGQDADQIGAISSQGHLFWLIRESSQCILTELAPSPHLDIILTHVATIDTEAVAVTFREIGNASTRVYQFGGMGDFKEWYSIGDPAKIHNRYQISGTCAAFIGGATAFVLLTDDGNVFTWGDNYRRWELGRIPDEETLADEPAIVEDLAGIPIKKVVAQLGLYGALSEFNDLYIWGEVTSCTDGFKLTDYQDVVNLVDLGEEVNVVDFGLGASHFVCITDSGSIFMLGSNSDQQLLSADSNQIYHKWNRVPNIKASRVVCGYWTTFLLVTS